jgi:intracellular sulfur oxidation DsrE/DsrF family protein
MKAWLLAVVILGVALAAGLSPRLGENRAASEEKPKMLRVVVHINFGDADQQGHGLRNVENILKAAKGEATVEVVCHGAGLSLLVEKQTKHAEQIGKLLKQGVQFAACENTMREKSISKDDLLPGVTPVPSGAAEVVRKQQEGYSYFKP